MSDPSLGDHARLEPRLNGADNMHACARAFWCASRRTIRTGRTVCVCMLSSVSVQFLSSFCPVSVIPFALTSRERCHTHAAVDPPSVSEAHRKLHCRVHAYHRCYSCRHHRKPKQGCSAGVRSLALQVCVLWRCVCQNAPTSPTRVSQCVRPGALACDDWLGGIAL